MDVLDVLIILLVGLSVVTGFRRGAAMQLVIYAGLILGLFIGALLAPRFARLSSDPFNQAAIALGVLLTIAALGDAAGWAVGRVAWAAARRSRLDPVDAAVGSGVGAVAALLATWFLAFNLVQGPFPIVSRQIRGSAIIRALDVVLPRPPAFLAEVRAFLNRFGFPEVFEDLPPAPAGPVAGPSEGEVGAAVAAADQSTLKVVGEACGRIQEGTGFLVAERYLVTNAHVVAGVTEPEVQHQQTGRTIGAVTVLFNPNVDIAVLHLDDQPERAISLLERDLNRGADGAVLGFPGGGSLRGGAAAVLRRMVAVGRDIYGDHAVRREVYELQARVRPGNSGGPFVTPRGEVAGIVFAASTTDDDVGYAITSLEADPRVDRAIGRVSAVDTGPCIR